MDFYFGSFMLWGWILFVFAIPVVILVVIISLIFSHRDKMEAQRGQGPVKRLYKSREDRMIFGVCGGLGEYFNLDPTIIRIALIAFILLGGSGLLLYLIGAIAIPNKPISQG